MSSLPVQMFEPRGGFRPDWRFGMATPIEEPRPEPQEPADDPLEVAFAEGYARGSQDAAAIAEQHAREAEAGRSRIETAFERLADEQTVELERRLRETILLLCEQTLAPLTTDPDALAHRINKALGLLRRTQDERIVRMHPEDLALVADRLSESIRVEPDPSLPRGQLLVETSEGGIEDGPDQWRRVLSEALRL